MGGQGDRGSQGRRARSGPEGWRGDRDRVIRAIRRDNHYAKIRWKGVLRLRPMEDKEGLLGGMRGEDSNVNMTADVLPGMVLFYVVATPGHALMGNDNLQVLS